MLFCDHKKPATTPDDRFQKGIKYHVKIHFPHSPCYVNVSLPPLSFSGITESPLLDERPPFSPVIPTCRISGLRANLVGFLSGPGSLIFVPKTLHSYFVSHSLQSPTRIYPPAVPNFFLCR